MKYFLRLMALFMCVGALCAHATTVTSTTKIIGPDGQPFTGTLTLQLPFAGVNTSTNQLVLATPVTANIFNGIITQPLVVTGNDVMSPAMPYAALYMDLSGNPVTRQMYYITGASFDVGSAPATPNFLNTNVIAGTTLTITGNTSLNLLNVSGVSTMAAITATTITATTVNKLTLTPPATSAIFTILDGKTAKFDNTLEFAGTDGTKMTFPSTSDTVLGLAAVQAPTGKTLTGTSTGNTVNLFPSGCTPQGLTASITGTGALADIYTCPLPANVVENNKILHVICSGVHDTGTVGVILAMNINGQNIITSNTGTTASQSWSMEAYVLRTGTTTGQAWGIANINTGNNGTMTAFSVGLTGLSWTSGTQTLNCQFNVAATDHITGRVWAPMSIQ